jgi:SAM-dependent methyltransferase
VVRKERATQQPRQFEASLHPQPAAQVQAQVGAVERYISLEPRSRVLDISCGSGRQTLELARRGYRVLGIDSQEGPLAAARAAAREERLNVHFLHTDIRQISYRGEFDAVVNLQPSIVYLPNDRDHLRVLEGTRKGLKAGGRLLLDMLNKEWLMRHFEPSHGTAAESAGGSSTLDRLSFDLETGRLNDRRTIVGPDGGRMPAVMSLRVYTLTEVKTLLDRAGLVFLKAWGGYEGEPYGLDSPRMVVLAQRPAEEPPRPPKGEGLISALRIKGRGRRG